jgi:hypothetical protein
MAMFRWGVYVSAGVLVTAVAVNQAAEEERSDV